MTGSASDQAASSAMAIIRGFMASRVTSVAAELGLADLLARGAQTAATLAERTGTHAPSLRRLLRALAAIGFVDEVEPGHFALTALGTQLRTGVDGSVRNFALMFGGERAWRSWGDLLHSVRTGEPAATRLYGMNGFEYFSQRPAQSAIFNGAMAEHTRQIGAAAVAAYDFSRFRNIVDVGGGNGALLAIILTACPALRGIVYDLPGGCDGAHAHLEAAGVANRCEVTTGDFFCAVPAGADAYILKNVIHDWDDEHSIAILGRCRAAILAEGTLFLLHRLMPERMEPCAAHQHIALMDINMLVMPGGRERTERGFGVLLEAAGFRQIAAIPLRGAPGHAIIEAAPI
jgi:hypothetical protein